jgi:hypothetical protein
MLSVGKSGRARESGGGGCVRWEVGGERAMKGGRGRRRRWKRKGRIRVSTPKRREWEEREENALRPVFSNMTLSFNPNLNSGMPER